MAVKVVNLTLEQGVDFSISLSLRLNGAPINLTGYQFFSKMRKHPGSSIYYPFNVSIILPEAFGNIIIEMPSSINSTIPPGRYLYDLKGSNDEDNKIAKYFKGTVMVEGTLT